MRIIKNNLRLVIAGLICVVAVYSERVKTGKFRGVAMGPLNDARLEGDQVTLQCESTGEGSRIAWFEYASGNPYGRQISDGEYILEGHPDSERYTILHEDETSYDLLINDSVVADGGTYRCLDLEDPVDETASAELIMKSGDPVCVSTTSTNGEVIEGHQYSHTCTVNYKGNVSPVMMWTGPEPYTLDETTTSETVSSKVTFTASTTIDGSQYSCTTNYNADDFDDFPADYASNTPTYEYVYEGAVLDVYSSCPCSGGESPIFGDL